MEQKNKQYSAIHHGINTNQTTQGQSVWVKLTQLT